MSLILDALSRAEREKRGRDGAVPDLLAQPQYSGSAPSRRRVLAGIGAIALLCALAVLVFEYLDVPEQPAAGPAATAPAETEAARATGVDAGAPAAAAPPAQGREDAAATKPQAVARRPAAPAAGGAAAEPGAQVRALYAAAQSPEPEKIPDAASDDVAATAPTGRVQTPAADAPAPGLVEETVDLDAVLREVRSAAEEGSLSAHTVPLLAEQSKQFRDSVPTLMYLRHDFNAAGGSTVFINGQNLRVGQRTRGVELREILADSVILRFEGTDFRLRALNSWVNL